MASSALWYITIRDVSEFTVEDFLDGCPPQAGRRRPGALFKTPRDRKEEKRTSGVERVMVGDVRTAIVGVEHLPILEMGNEPLGRRAKRRDPRVVFLVGQG